MPVELSREASELRAVDVVVELAREGAQEGPDPAHRAYRTAGMTGRPGEDLLVASEDGAVQFVGVGPGRELDPGAIRRALARAAPSLAGYATVGVPLPGDAGAGSDVVVAASEGILLGSHRFERFGTRSVERGGARFLLGAPPGLEPGVAEQALAFGVASAEAGIEARDLANTPPNHCTPEDLAKHAESLANIPGLAVEVWREDELTRQRCGGILGVGQGSASPPRLLLLDYRGAGTEAPIALAGKGITFDAGGTSVKHETHLEWMKIDMAGGAAVLGAMHAIARLALPVNVVAAVPCADNLTGPTAIKPGDVLTLRSGKTCEVVNTDYEGRVVLADALDVLLERSPTAIVIAATLWGGGEALGEEISPLFGNDATLVQEVLGAAAAAGEPAWQLPLWPPYRRELESMVADVKNKPSDAGAMITAAMFLGEFTGDVPWAYLDLGETAWAGRRWDLGEAGATGVPARTMLRLAQARVEADRSANARAWNSEA